MKKARVVKDERFKGKPDVYLVKVGSKTLGRHSNKSLANRQANAYNRVKRGRK